MSGTDTPPRRFVFLDRDGVINRERGTYTTTVEEWQWADGAFGGLRKLAEAGFTIIVITNQACIAKGLQTEEGLAHLHAYMLREIRARGGDVHAIYHCPHVTGDQCGCRKPDPGLILRAARDFDIPLADTFMVGDSLRDMEAGRRAGTRTLLITAGPGADSERTRFDGGEHEAADLDEAADIIIRETP